MTRIVLASLLLVAITACGGKSGTLTLNIVTSPGDDPFADAAQVRFTVGTDMSHVTTVPVSMGHFDYKISFKPNDMTGPVLIEALDSGGTVVAHGTTPFLLLSAVDQGPIAAWVGRPGRVQPAAAMLPKAIAETATTYVPGLGILYAGGRDATPGHRVTQHRLGHRAAADVALADDQDRFHHLVAIAAVRPALMAGSNRLSTRLKRTSPLPSTYTTSFGFSWN